MASAANGQIGGLEMNDESRRSMAQESRAWTCAVCANAKTNQDIMAECEAQWKEQSNGNESALPVGQSVPEELRLAYKDDMERGPPTPMVQRRVDPERTEEPEASEETAPAGKAAPRTLLQPPPLSAKAVPPRAGPVANLLARSKPPPSPLRATAYAQPAASRDSEPSTPTPTDSTSQATTRSGGEDESAQVAASSPRPIATAQAVRQVRAAGQDSVPSWLDKIIIGVALGLAVMIIKKFLG